MAENREKYAQVILDISARGLDRPFTYRIPDALADTLRAGSIVMVPFGAGNVLRKGYVTGFTDRTAVAPEKIKEIDSEIEPSRGYSMEDNSEFYLRLAAWMKNRYGSTMATALRTVLASRKPGKIRELRQIPEAPDCQGQAPEGTPGGPRSPLDAGDDTPACLRLCYPGHETGGSGQCGHCSGAAQSRQCLTEQPDRDGAESCPEADRRHSGQ